MLNVSEVISEIFRPVKFKWYDPRTWMSGWFIIISIFGVGAIAIISVLSYLVYTTISKLIF